MNLYELTEAYRQVVQLIDDGAEGLEDTLDSIADSFEVKSDNIVKVIRTKEAQAEAYKNEAARLTEKRKTEENAVKRLKEYLEGGLQAIGKRKVKGELFTVAIQKNPPSLHVINESYIPTSFFVPQDPILNKKELMEELKLGHEIHGAELRQGESLRIR